MTMQSEAETLLPPRLSGTHAIIPARLADGRAAELEWSCDTHVEPADPSVGYPSPHYYVDGVTLEAVRVGGLKLHPDTWNRLVPRDADERAAEFLDEKAEAIAPEGDGEP